MDPVSRRHRHKFGTSGINDNATYNLMGRNTKDDRVSQDCRSSNTLRCRQIDSALSCFTNEYDNGSNARQKKHEDKSNEIEPTIPENISSKIKQISLGKIEDSQIKKRMQLKEQIKNGKCREPIKAVHPMLNGKTYQIHASRDNVYKGSVKINQYKIQGMCQSPRPSHVADKYLGYNSFRKIVPKHENSLADKTNLKRFSHVISDDPNLKRLESAGDLENHSKDSDKSKSHMIGNMKSKKIDVTPLNKLPKHSIPIVTNKNCTYGNSNKLNERYKKFSNIKSDVMINKELGKKIPKQALNHKKVKNDTVLIRESVRKSRRQDSFDSKETLQETTSKESEVRKSSTCDDSSLADLIEDDKRRNENIININAKYEKENKQMFCGNKGKKTSTKRRGLSEVRPSVKNCSNIAQSKILLSNNKRKEIQNNEDSVRSRKSIWTKQENDNRNNCEVDNQENTKDGSGEIFREEGVRKRGYSEERFDRQTNYEGISSDGDTDLTNDSSKQLVNASQNNSNFLRDCHFMRTNELYMELMSCRRKRNLIKTYVNFNAEDNDNKMKIEKSPYFKAETSLNESPYHNNFTKIIDDPVKVKSIKSLVDNANKSIEKKKKLDAAKETTDSSRKREKDKDAILLSRSTKHTMIAYLEESKKFQTINKDEEEHETLQKLEQLNDKGKEEQSKLLPIYRNSSKHRNTLEKSSVSRSLFKPRNYSYSQDSVVNQDSTGVHRFSSERASSNKSRMSAEKLNNVSTFDKPLPKNIVSIIDSRIYQVENNLKQEKKLETGASKISEPLIKSSAEKTVPSENRNRNSSKTRTTSKSKHCSNLLNFLPTGGLPTDNSENYTKLKQREISMAKPVS